MFLSSPYFSISKVLCVGLSSTEEYFTIFFLYVFEYKLVISDFPSLDNTPFITSSLYKVTLLSIFSLSEASVSTLDTLVFSSSVNDLYVYLLSRVLLLLSSSISCVTSFINPSLLVIFVELSVYS